MFWLSLGVIGLSALLIKFGMLSVMTGVLSVDLKVSLVLIVLLAVLLVWLWYNDSEI
jgi:membrane protein implicated in regulation of membrane protease activity